MNQNNDIISKTTVGIDILQDLLHKYYVENIKMDSILNVRFLLGKNAQMNWSIYKASNHNDTVFHLDKFPSPYVIINVPIDNLTNEHIYVAALLCKSKSKYKTQPNIGVLYTSISNTMLGTKPGSFIINSNNKKKVIYV